MDFSQAFTALREGRVLSRKGWNNPNISVHVHYPDSTSENTEPYIYMAKKGSGETEGINKRFPLDLSAESLFATDWFIVE